MGTIKQRGEEVELRGGGYTDAQKVKREDKRGRKKLIEREWRTSTSLPA